MPDKQTIERAKKDQREGKSASTQAGEFVREQIHHIREGKHGAKSAKQAIAIGLSQARRSGVDIPDKSKSKKLSEKSGSHDAGDRHHRITKPATSAKRSVATTNALKKEGRQAASTSALSAQSRSAARKRTAGDRSAAARKAAETKGAAGRSAAARKAAATRAAHRAH